MSQIVLTKNFGSEDSWKIEGAESRGAYETVRRSLKTMTPESVRALVEASGLRGCGGSGRPVGAKWRSFCAQKTGKRTLVVNGNEGEPGTFKDRWLMERDPHLILEGALWTALAIEADEIVIFVRGEYALAWRRMAEAAQKACLRNYFGPNILGSALSIRLRVFRGAGAYICGEETAILEAMEGKRGYPRKKSGSTPLSYYGDRSALVQNVETVSWIGPLVACGADWFKRLGQDGVGGNGLFSVSGHVKRPGLYELPMGISLKEVLFEHAGGLSGSAKLKAVLPGGLSSAILKGDQIGVKMDADSLEKIGSMLGTAAVIAMDETVSMAGVLRHLIKFYASESCGECAPCRESLNWALKVITRISEGEGRQSDLDLVTDLAARADRYGFCAFGRSFARPVASCIEKFKDELQAFIGGKTTIFSSVFIEETVSPNKIAYKALA